MLSAPRRAAAAACALVPLSLAAATARAQTTTFAVDRLVMAGAPGDGIAVWRPEMSAETRFFGQLGLGYALNPLRVDNYVHNLNDAAKIQGNPLTSQLMGYADVGAEILGRVSLQVSFPFVAYQTGNPTNDAAANLPQPSVDLKQAAPGDLRVEARVIIFRTSDRSFKLGLSAAAYAPTGNRYSFAGDDGPGAAFGFAAEYDARVVFVTLNAAYRLRPTVALDELVVSSEVLYALGVYVPLWHGRLRVGAELFGGFGASPNKLPVHSVPPSEQSNIGKADTAPLEWMLNGRAYFTPRRQVYVGLGAGTRLDDGYAPDFRAVAVLGASFGVADTNPRSPGSRYVFDTEGPKDTDHDGIPDDVDACPLEPGELDPDPTKIGCPRYIRRVKGSDEIEVLKRIEFEFDRSRILPVSYPILDEVVSLLQANPAIQKMVVEGHTDDMGTTEYNQRLSEERAASVTAYLVEKGVDARRLLAKGYGLTRPRAENHTEEGRQQNRRVEFHITEQSAPDR
jgi:outer membrane protein OmpA-like peptidoglycan-associated protein